MNTMTDIEQLKPLIFLIAIVIGQILMVYIPYRNKRIQDGRPFDRNYVYSMLLGFISMAVISIQSDAIRAMPLSIDTVLILLFLAGGAQKIINDVTPQTKLE